VRSEWLLRREMIEICRLLYARGLVVGADGNLSARVAADAILVTPAGAALAELRPEALIIVRPDFPPTSARRSSRPTTELPMHLTCYEERPDIGAVVHAHPPLATALTLAGIDLAVPVLPEVVLHLGAVPTAPYATPSTDEGARAVRELIRRHDVLLLERHGALAVGADPRDAFAKLERVEHAARVLLAAGLPGAARALGPDELARLEELRRR
jgi:L-fuculose-phosphate aldolase